MQAEVTIKVKFAYLPHGVWQWLFTWLRLRITWGLLKKGIPFLLAGQLRQNLWGGSQQVGFLVSSQGRGDTPGSSWALICMWALGLSCRVDERRNCEEVSSCLKSDSAPRWAGVCSLTPGLSPLQSETLGTWGGPALRGVRG